MLVGQLVGGGGRDGHHLVASWVQGLSDPADIAALSGGVPALIGDDHRDLFPVNLIVQLF